MTKFVGNWVKEVVSTNLKYPQSNLTELQRWLDWIKSKSRPNIELDKLYDEKYSEEVLEDIDLEDSVSEEVKNAWLKLELVKLDSDNFDLIKKIQEKIVFFWWETEIITEWRWKLNVFASITRKYWRKKYILYNETFAYRNTDIHFWKNYKESEVVPLNDFLELQSQEDFEEYFTNLMLSKYESDDTKASHEQEAYDARLREFVYEYRSEDDEWLLEAWHSIVKVKPIDLYDFVLDFVTSDWKKYHIGKSREEYALYTWLRSLYVLWEIKTEQDFIKAFESLSVNIDTDAFYNRIRRLNGKADEKRKELYQKELEAAKKLIEQIRKDFKLGDLNLKIRKRITEISDNITANYVKMKKELIADGKIVDKLIQQTKATIDSEILVNDSIYPEEGLVFTFLKSANKSIDVLLEELLHAVQCPAYDKTTKLQTLSNELKKIDKNTFNASFESLTQVMLWNELKNVDRICDLFNLDFSSKYTYPTDRTVKRIKEAVEHDMLEMRSENKEMLKARIAAIKKIDSLIDFLKKKFDIWDTYIINTAKDYADEFDVQLVSVFKPKKVIKTLESLKNDYDIELEFNLEIEIWFWSNQEIEIDYSEFKELLSKARKSKWKVEEDILNSITASIDVIEEVERFFANI